MRRNLDFVIETYIARFRHFNVAQSTVITRFAARPFCFLGLTLFFLALARSPVPAPPDLTSFPRPDSSMPFIH